MQLHIATDRLMGELDTLAGYSDVPAPAVTRVVFSETDRRARDYIKRLCLDAGLLIREDAVGNTFARWPGVDPNLPAVGTGSHIDAIPNAGRYDGTVGVLGGLEAIRALQRASFRPQRPLELLLFTSEEPTRFGIGCLGSRLLSRSLDGSADQQLQDSAGRTLQELRQASGFAGPLESVALSPGYYAAFLELHIEQGPLLEQQQIALGVVTAIAAPASLRLHIEGEGGHAGAVLMPDRRDALAASAELMLAIEAAARSTGAVDTVATAGTCEVFPGAINSIPSRVVLGLDVRDIDAARRDSVLSAIHAAAESVSRRRGVTVRTEPINADAPAHCDPRLVASLAKACAVHDLTFQKMVSRAYHDSLFMSRVAPTAMLFIPCRAGVSHRPDEYASPEAITDGVLVLAETLAALSHSA